MANRSAPESLTPESSSMRAGTEPRTREVGTIASRATRLALIFLVPLALVGCHDRRHRHVEPHPAALASSTEFTWSGDLRGYDAFDEYIWDTVWDEVFIEFEAFDFHGDVRIQILDDTFTVVFDDTYFGTGGDLLVQTSSDLGFSGEWTIRITSDHVFGDVRLTLD